MLFFLLFTLLHQLFFLPLNGSLRMTSSLILATPSSGGSNVHGHMRRFLFWNAIIQALWTFIHRRLYYSILEIEQWQFLLRTLVIIIIPLVASLLLSNNQPNYFQILSNWSNFTSTGWLSIEILIKIQQVFFVHNI